MTKKQKIISGVVAVAVLSIAYFAYDSYMYVKTDNAQVGAHTVMLASKVSGFVLNVEAQEGQQVKKGDILIEIDERDYQNALRQYKGELSSLEAKKRDAEKNFNRISELYKKDVVSTQQYDQATTAFAEVRSKYEALSAQVAQAELNLENTKVRAPSDGFIAKKAVEVGQLVSPGVPLYGFVDSSERWVIANFKETELAGIHVGNDVDVKIDALSGKSFKGKVLSLSAATGATFTLLPPDNATGNFTKVIQRIPVKILIENLNPQEMESLRAGLSAYVKVHKR